MSSIAQLKKAIVIGGRDEALDLTVLLANAGVMVLLAVPEGWVRKAREALGARQEIWESSSAIELVQIRAIKSIVKEWGKVDLLLDVRDEALQEDSLWSTIKGHIAPRVLKAKISNLKDEPPEGWAGITWLGPLLQHRHLELQVSSLAAKAWLDLLQRRMGLECFHSENISILKAWSQRLTRLMLDQLEEGAPIEFLNVLWSGILRAAPWLAPDALSAQRIQTCIAGEEYPKFWTESLLSKGVVDRSKDHVEVYAGQGRYRRAENSDLQNYQECLASQSLEMRVRQFFKIAAAESKWLWAWVREMLLLGIQHQVSSNRNLDHLLASNLGMSVGPLSFLDQLGTDWLMPRLQLDGFEELEQFVRQHQPLFAKVIDNHWVSNHGGSLLKNHLSAYRAADRLYIRPALENAHAALWDGGESLGILILRGPQNRLTPQTLELLRRSVEWCSAHNGGLIIGHEGLHFSAGEDWGLMLGLAMEKRYNDLEKWLLHSQTVMTELKTVGIPVIVAAEGLCLGASASLLSHAHGVCCGSQIGVAFEGAALGLPPTMGMLKEMSLRACLKNETEDQLQSDLVDRMEFLIAGQARWSISRLKNMLLPPESVIVRGRESRLALAAQQLRMMLDLGWSAPHEHVSFSVAGGAGRAVLEQQLYIQHATGAMDDEQLICSSAVAAILCGGELSHAGPISESVLLEGERQLFLSQIGKENVQARLTQALKGGLRA